MQEFLPSPRLRRKYALWVWASVALYLPLALLALIPDLGWVYLAWFVGITLLWVLPTLAILGPYCRTIRYALTDDEIVVRKGLLTKTEKTIPYSKVTNVELKRGVFDRALSLGTLQIHTAGYSQQTNAEAVMSGLEDWEGVRRQVMARVHAREAEEVGPARGAEGAVPADAAPLLQELLAELRAIRATVDGMRGW
jgi:membrane protein YdbS with pleckstrin-like domain